MRVPSRAALPASAALCLLLLSGCGDEGTTASPTATTAVPTEVATSDPTEGATPDSTTSPAGEPSPGTQEPTVAPSLDETTGPGGRCVSPLGYSFAVPAGWVTNTGDVAAPCSYLDPEPFTVPEATDARPAAISVYVDPVPFDEVSAERDVQTSRDETTVAGVPAVRVEAVEDGRGLYPEGTRRTSWYLDLPPAAGQDEPRTLIADVVAPPASDLDHEELTAVLDRLVTTLQLEPATASTS